MVKNLTAYITFTKQKTDDEIKRKIEARNDSFRSDSDSEKDQDRPSIKVDNLDVKKEEKKSSKNSSSSISQSYDFSGEPSGSGLKKAEAISDVDKSQKSENLRTGLNHLKRMVTS